MFFLRCVRMRTDSQWETNRLRAFGPNDGREHEQNDGKKLALKVIYNVFLLDRVRRRACVANAAQFRLPIHIACGYVRWLVLSGIKMNSEQNDVTKTTATKHIVTYNYYSSRSAHIFLSFTFCHRIFFRSVLPHALGSECAEHIKITVRLRF